MQREGYFKAFFLILSAAHIKVRETFFFASICKSLRPIQLLGVVLSENNYGCSWVSGAEEYLLLGHFRKRVNRFPVFRLSVHLRRRRIVF